MNNYELVARLKGPSKKKVTLWLRMTGQFRPTNSKVKFFLHVQIFWRIWSSFDTDTKSVMGCYSENWNVVYWAHLIKSSSSIPYNENVDTAKPPPKPILPPKLKTTNSNNNNNKNTRTGVGGGQSSGTMDNRYPSSSSSSSDGVPANLQVKKSLCRLTYIGLFVVVF